MNWEPSQRIRNLLYEAVFVIYTVYVGTLRVKNGVRTELRVLRNFCLREFMEKPRKKPAAPWIATCVKGCSWELVLFFVTFCEL